MSAADPVAAISEAEARGETAALYADIRATLGVPVVNLVWRHLASIEGALPWAWQAVRPAYLSGAVAHHAHRLKSGLALPALPAVPVEVLDSLGLAPAQQRAIRQVLDAYDRSNPMNWLALSALLQENAPVRPGDATPLMRTGPEDALDFELPVLPALDTLAPATRALVLRLNALDGERDDAILASMFRHLAHWPAMLALMWAPLSMLADDGRLRQASRQVAEHGAREAALLRATLPAAAGHAPHPAGRTALADFLARIGLPRMIAITTMFRMALREPRA